MVRGVGNEPVVGGNGVSDHSCPCVGGIGLLTVTGSCEVEAERGDPTRPECSRLAEVHVTDLVLVAGEAVEHEDCGVRTGSASRFGKGEDAGYRWSPAGIHTKVWRTLASTEGFVSGQVGGFAATAVAVATTSARATRMEREPIRRTGHLQDSGSNEGSPACQRLNSNSASCVVPSVSLIVRIRHVPAHAFCVFQTYVY